MSAITTAAALAAQQRWAPRAILRIVLIVLLLLIVFVPHMGFRAVGQHSPVPRLFLRGGAWIAGLNLRSHGDRIPRNVLYVANHVSWMDILVLGGVSGCAFVSKAEVEAWPIIGWLADQVDTVYVKREDRRAVIGQASEVGDALATGRPVALFPEGTTNDGITIKPFRASLLASVVDPPEGIHVQPVALDYGADGAEIAWTEEELVPNLREVLARKGRINVGLHFLEPLTGADTSNRKLMASHARDAIVHALAQAGNTASGRVRYRL